MVACLWCNIELREILFEFRGGIRAQIVHSHSPNRAGNNQVQESTANNNVAMPNFVTMFSSAQHRSCLCGLPISTAVSKSEANLGRHFHACSKKQDDITRCNFFEWADAVNNNSSNNLTSTDENGPICGCGLPSTRRTVKKEGSNKGKQFYGCSKSQNDPTKCDMFTVMTNTNFFKSGLLMIKLRVFHTTGRC